MHELLTILGPGVLFAAGSHDGVPSGPLGWKMGHLFVVATLLPLASFLLLLLLSGVWCILRRYRNEKQPGREAVFQFVDKLSSGRLPAFVALGAIAVAFVLCAIGFVEYHRDHAFHTAAIERAEEEVAEAKAAVPDEPGKARTRARLVLAVKQETLHQVEEAWANLRAAKWEGRLFKVIHLQSLTTADRERGTLIDIGFHIDHLSAVMFVMVTFIASLIHLFSMGYMSEELAPEVEDHHVHAAHGHLHRRGRFGRFFMYLSLFCFSMLNLILADNLFQVFVSWELVGVCSFLLIGFYFERQSASNAANKAFITNRVGDAGFILGLLIVWAYLGTFNFQGMFAQVRHPLEDAHHRHGALAGKIVRADYVEETNENTGEVTKTLHVAGPGQGSQVVLFPSKPGHFHNLDAPRQGAKGEDAIPGSEVETVGDRTPDDFGVMPYWMLVAAGLGIFLGCVGKSAQFPLQVWLPDAMEGPTPVSALIHAATMVAAGVYLVGRCYPLFTAEVLLTIAYTGGITLFVAASIALVATDIKKVLAYSTVSQLGYMMLALGVGGWVAGLFHLITHAFFKALLFLGSGSVIYGCHHEQEMTKMGGLYPKMKITALTMLAGVLAIAGIPLFSGWYSKDSILAHALGFVYVHRQHALLFVLPLVTAGITTFYMFRMWFMTFTGEPRDEHVHDHAHESPWMMTLPLILLAICSVGIAWGWPVWDATKSQLEHTMHHAQPTSVLADFGHLEDHHEHFPAVAAKPHERSERHWAHKLHDHAGFLALGMVGIGLVFAFATYYFRALDPAEAAEQFPKVYAFLQNKWYFDHVYSVLLVRPAIIVARGFRSFDLGVIDGIIHTVARTAVWVAKVGGLFDKYFIDWLVNLVGNVTHAIGERMRSVQTGYLRSYILFLVLAAVAIFMLLSYFAAPTAAG